MKTATVCTVVRVSVSMSGKDLEVTLEGPKPDRRWSIVTLADTASARHAYQIGRKVVVGLEPVPGRG